MHYFSENSHVRADTKDGRWFTRQLGCMLRALDRRVRRGEMGKPKHPRNRGRVRVFLVEDSVVLSIVFRTMILFFSVGDLAQDAITFFFFFTHWV